MEPSRKSAMAATDCDACRVRIDGLCQDYSPEALQVISSYASGKRVFDRGQDLFSPGDACNAVFNLLDGWVSLYNLLEDGGRQILHFALPGAVLGFHPADGAAATYGAQALTEVRVCIIPREALTLLSKKYPEIGMRLAGLTSRDQNLAYARLTSIGRRSAQERVAHLLLELFIRYRVQWPGHNIEEMNLPLTQEHIGDALGLTGVHVNRVLNNLKNMSVVEFHHRKLRILNPDKLVEIADLDPKLIDSWTHRELPSGINR